MKTATQTTVSRSATAMEMLKANIRAYEQSKPLPYTKEQFSNPENEDFCAEHIRYWNNALPRAEQFTKHEHSEGCENHEIGCRVLEKTSWNQNLPYAEQYTKQDILNTKGCKAWDLTYWNRTLPNAKQFTKDEHSNAKGLNLKSIKHWNAFASKLEQYP